MESPPTIIAVTDDLLFGSRISAVAASHGAQVRTCRTGEKASAMAQESSAGCILIDLAVIGHRLVELMSALEQLPRRLTTVAYGSHVDTAALRAAVEAGCDIVLPRSKFVEALETDLPHWLTPRPHESI